MPANFRAWLEAHHHSAKGVWVGFYRKATQRPSITWPESVDEALCFGWIDGIRKKIDEHKYKIRFTPRKAKSSWSAVNIGRVNALRLEGRMRAEGLAAFRRRKESSVYSFENRKTAKLTAEQEREFRRHRAAWDFFEAQPPGYRRIAAWSVIRAKRAETQQARLKRLISVSHRKRRIY